MVGIWVMKLSASVPDQLWANVYRDGESTSSVVQEGLRLLAAQRLQPQYFPNAKGTEFDDEHARQSLLEWVDGFVVEAQRLRRRGYQVGLEVAHALDWVTLETLPAGP